MTTVSPFNPLQQAGVRSKAPPDLIVINRIPTPTDFEFFPGALWLFPNQSYWGLLGFSSPQVANWTQLGGGTVAIAQLRDNFGALATPVGGIVNVVGAVGIETVAVGDTLTIQLTGGGEAVDTLTGNSGGQVPPEVFPSINPGNINTVGTGSITVIGTPSLSKLVTQLTGLTNHAVLVGGATSIDGTTPTLTNVGPLTNGQLVIGSTGLDPVAGNLTSTGGTITVTPGPGTLNIDLAGGGLAIDSFVPDTGTNPVVPTAAGLVNLLGRSGSKTLGGTNTLTVQSPPFADASSSATSTLNSGEFVTGAFTRTLPASAGLADGDLFIYVCISASALVIQSVGAQKIRIGALLSGAAGTATSTAIGDSLTLRFRAADGFFYAVSVVGTWTLSP